MIFFGTFMQKQAFKNMYVKIQADSNALARECMFAHFGDKFMSVYTDVDNELERQIKGYNLQELSSIRVINDGHGAITYIKG